MLVATRCQPQSIERFDSAATAIRRVLFAPNATNIVLRRLKNSVHLFHRTDYANVVPVRLIVFILTTTMNLVSFVDGSARIVITEGEALWMTLTGCKSELTFFYERDTEPLLSFLSISSNKRAMPQSVRGAIRTVRQRRALVPCCTGAQPAAPTYSFRPPRAYHPAGPCDKRSAVSAVPAAGRGGPYTSPSPQIAVAGTLPDAHRSRSQRPTPKPQLRRRES